MTGTAEAANPQPVSQALPAISRIEQMIGDPAVPVADISRVIALQIADAIRQMQAESPFRRRVSQRDLNDQVKAYRELQKTLTESEMFSKKDVLNLDGPKFKFVFMELIGLFRRALKDAGMEEVLAQNIMLQLGDLVKMHDERIRQELGKIGQH